MEKDKEDLIPLEIVLNDMENDNGMVASAARDYYKLHYASEEEINQMEKEDHDNYIFSCVMFGVPCLMLLIGFILYTFTR